jgi:hypothetical protein
MQSKLPQWQTYHIRNSSLRFRHPKKNKLNLRRPNRPSPHEHPNSPHIHSRWPLLRSPLFHITPKPKTIKRSIKTWNNRTYRNAWKVFQWKITSVRYEKIESQETSDNTIDTWLTLRCKYQTKIKYPICM